MSKFKCPNNIGDLDTIMNQLQLCRKDLFKRSEAMIESGAAKNIKDASRKIAEETNRKPESIRNAIQREKASIKKKNEKCSTATPPKTGDEKCSTATPPKTGDEKCSTATPPKTDLKVKYEIAMQALKGADTEVKALKAEITELKDTEPDDALIKENQLLLEENVMLKERLDKLEKEFEAFCKKYDQDSEAFNALVNKVNLHDEYFNEDGKHLDALDDKVNLHDKYFSEDGKRLDALENKILPK